MKIREWDQTEIDFDQPDQAREHRKPERDRTSMDKGRNVRRLRKQDRERKAARDE